MSGNSVKRKAQAQEIRGTNASSVLSKLFRRMLVFVAGTINVDENNIDKIPVDNPTFMENTVSSGKYEQLMLNFVNDPRNCIPENKKEQTSARGNLQKELLKNGMSWKVFVKSLRFLDLVGFDIQITAHHRNGKKSVHTEHMNINKKAKLPDVITNPKNNIHGYFATSFNKTPVTPKIHSDVRKAYEIDTGNDRDIQ